MFQKKGNNYLINFILLNNLVYFSYAVVANVNFLWIINNFLINLIILFKTRIYNKKLLSLFTILNLILFTSFIHISHKYTSTIFTFFCIISAILQLNFISNNLFSFNFKLFIKNTILFIFYIYILQALLFLLHLPVLNAYGSALSNDSIFRFNSLLAEPSYSSFCVTMLLYILNIQNRNNRIFRDYVIEFIGLLLIILFSSVIGLITYFLYLLFIHRKFYKKLYKIEIIFFFLIAIYYSSTLVAIDRIFNTLGILLEKFTLLDLVAIEPSGAFRIVPTIIYFESLNFQNILNTIFGYGAGTSEFFFNESLFSYGYGYTPDGKFQGGFIPAFLVDYGIIVFFLLMYYYIKLTFIKSWHFQFLLLIFLLLNLNINNQLFWFTFYIFYINKQLIENPRNFEPNIY